MLGNGNIPATESPETWREKQDRKAEGGKGVTLAIRNDPTQSET